MCAFFLQEKNWLRTFYVWLVFVHYFYYNCKWDIVSSFAHKYFEMLARIFMSFSFGCHLSTYICSAYTKIHIFSPNQKPEGMLSTILSEACLPAQMVANIPGWKPTSINVSLSLFFSCSTKSLLGYLGTFIRKHFSVTGSLSKILIYSRTWFTSRPRGNLCIIFFRLNAKYFRIIL